MRFWTIWTMPAMALSERLRRTRDWAALEATNWIPKRVRYWVTLREIGKATTHSENVPATPLEDILQNLDAPKNLA